MNISCACKAPAACWHQHFTHLHVSIAQIEGLQREAANAKALYMHFSTGRAPSPCHLA